MRGRPVQMASSPGPRASRSREARAAPCSCFTAFGDTPQTLRYLGGRLHAAGFTVRAPLLPGHGRGLRDFAAASAEDYASAARDELARLRERAPGSGVIGLSMGGAHRGEARRRSRRCARPRAAGALSDAATRRGAAWRARRRCGRWPCRTSVVAAAMPPCTIRSRARKALRTECFRRAPCARSARRRRLAAARCRRSRVPTLVVNSREDNRIPFALAETATASLAGPTERRWVTGCGHVITVDYCRDVVADMVLDFLARHAD